MALAPVEVSRISLFKASSLDFNGNNWVSGGCSLATPADATRLVVLKSGAQGRHIACSAVQESSTPTGSNFVFIFHSNKLSICSLKDENYHLKPPPNPSMVVSDETKEAKKAEAKAAPAKPKPAAKAAAKALPQMMEEDVIPSLRSTLEAQDDITDLELTFQDNRLEGSFLQKGKPYTFWAFFPDGVLTGPKGFSLSSYGLEVSTVEPFLVDEKKITPKHVVFWVEKRLAAQGIIPVWKE